MRTTHLVEEPPRRAPPAFTYEELVVLGVICATAATLLALLELIRLSFVLG